MKKVSAVLISFNEQEKIARALSSLQGVADEIIVVDSRSTDRTRQICRPFTDRVIERAWPGYRQQKQFATDQASHQWVLSLDCDEELSPALRRELTAWKTSSDPDPDGYFIPRLTWFMGRWIRHTTWHPDWQLRLFRPSQGKWKGGRVHESFRVDGLTARLQNPIQHYTYSDFSEYLQQLDRFSALAAADAHDAGKRAGLGRLVVSAPLSFVKNYFVKRGFLDGMPGLAVSALAAVSTLFKHLKLWELEQAPTESPSGDRSS